MLCKADPGGLPPGGGRGGGGSTPVGGEPGTGEGLRLIINLLSDGDAAKPVTGPAREGRDWRGFCSSGADSPVFFLRSKAE